MLSPIQFSLAFGLILSKSPFLLFYIKVDFDEASLFASPHLGNTIEHTRFHSFGTQFSPGNFRRRLTRLVSYYALFE